MPLDNEQSSEQNLTTLQRFTGVSWSTPSVSEQSAPTRDASEAEQEEGVSRTFLSSLLECPVCFGCMMPPIMQCPRGHMICESCHQMVTNCPVCRASLTDIRNLAMEKVASKLMFPCKNSYLGCRMRLPCADMKSHEERCEFSLYRCPYPDEKCPWQGPLSDVYQHMVATHEDLITMEGTEIVFLATNIDLEAAHDWTMVQNCFDRHFLLSLEKINIGDELQQFYASCRILGTPRDAAKFVYHITMQNDKRILRWKSEPISIRESGTLVNSDFLVLNKATVQLYLKDGNLALNVAITQVRESSGAATGD